MKRQPLSLGVAWLMLSLSCVVAAAQEIAIPLSDGNRALADYRPGDSGKPAVFILHGFLQTSLFSTVQLIAEELADNGYTVLAPTLTLNIDQRRNGLTCDAIQNHSVADNNDEIADWMAWLKAQGYKEIILIGHSSGSMQLLSYLSEERAITPHLFIATSIGPIRDWKQPQQVEAQLTTAMKLAQTTPRQIGNYNLAFCHNNYAAPAGAYLSYMAWTDSWVLEKLKRLPFPVEVILGSGDKWLPPDWLPRVSKAGLPLTTIEEASHNFTGPQEFEFQESILRLLEQHS
jgi:pimeloyl-ACP methyl ester carboxylesterase